MILASRRFSKFLLLIKLELQNSLQIILKKEFIETRQFFMNKEEQATQFKQQGNHAYKSADYKKALQLYSKAIEINPKDPAFYLNRALCYFNMKNFHQCISQCEKSIALNFNYIKAIKKKAAGLVQLLKFDEALAALKLANSIQKTQTTSNEIDQVEHYISNFNKYNQALKTQDYAQALSCVSYLIQKIPENRELLLIKIQCLAKTGATQDAAKALRAVDHEKTPETMYLKGIIQLYSGDSAKAQSYFSQGIKLDPENAKCQKALSKASKCEKFKQQGNALIKSSNWQSAQAKYTEALNLDPYNKKLNAIIYSNRALTYMKRKMWTRAAEDLNKSIELNPNYIKSYVRRAEVNMQRGEYTGAIQDYAKIQQLDPKIDMKAKIHQARKKQKQAKKKDYYAILGVSKTASDDQIKKAYKKMALKFHPDRNRNKSQVEQEQAAKMFRDINEAQDVLTNPQKRKMYDSGAMSYDGDNGADFSNFGNMGGFSNMGGFGGNGQSFKFSFNGQDMGGMGGMDPSKIFEMFMGGGMGGFGSSFSQRRKSAEKTSDTQGKNKFGGFGGFGGFDDFDFAGFGNMGSFGRKQDEKPKKQK